MELLYPSLLFAFFLLLFMIKLTEISLRSKTHRLPPGPWQLPVVGSLLHLIGSGLPHRSLRKLAKTHGPIMHLKLGEVSTIIISSPDAAREIMKTHDLTFASRPHINVIKIISYGKSMVFAPYGEYWRQLRRICVLELLSPRRVQSFQSIRSEEVLALVRSISATLASSPDPVIINLTQSMNSLINDIVMRAAIGSKCRDQTKFLSALDEAVEAATGFDLADLFPSSRLVSLLSGSRSKLERIHRNMDSVLGGIVQQHRERTAAGQSTDDLLDALLRLQEGGDSDFTLTDDSIKAVILDMFGAGSETSATTLTWAMSELMRNPRVMKRTQLEIRQVLGERPLSESETDKLSYLELVIKETLRLHLPVPLLIPRECRRTCEVLGYDIPEKTKVLVNAWAMARDPQHWGDDAEEFKPERFEGSKMDYKGANFEFLPFGSGRRICPGMSFGVANVKHTLVQLLCYFDWELPDGSLPGDLDMSENFGVTTRRRSDLYLRAIPNIHCPLV